MKRTLSLTLTLIIILTSGQNVLSADNDTLNVMLENTAGYIYKTVSTPQVGQVGGEWTIIGLARYGADIPKEYYDNYYKAVEDYVIARNGILHERKYTEYSRVILALTAIGKDPSNISGYNLLLPLGDYDKTVLQGINGPIWALIALDSGNYQMPQNPDAKTQSTREIYIEYILGNQLENGGFAISKASAQADVDTTAMALQALAKYQDRQDVRAATDKALMFLSTQQDSFDSVENIAQTIVALCELGITIDDPRFVKNGCTLLDNLAIYCTSEGGFKHTIDSDINLMSSEQGLYALSAAERLLNNKYSLYRMGDVADHSFDTPKYNYLCGLTGILILNLHIFGGIIK